MRNRTIIYFFFGSFLAGLAVSCRGTESEKSVSKVPLIEEQALPRPPESESEPAARPENRSESKRPVPPAQRGAALGLYSEDPDWSYMEFLEEMRSAGVSHVAIVVPWYLKTSKHAEIFKHPRLTVPMSTVKRTARDAKRLGFEVTIFPILRVEDKSDGGWRGELAPPDVGEFFENYKTFILRFAKAAEALESPVLSVGSELASMEVHDAKWREVIAAVREVYSGKILYSANWDHYGEVPFWDALDFVGVTGYFELAEEGADPTVDALVAAWKPVQGELEAFVVSKEKPLVLTEVGYLSQKNTAAHPWMEAADEALDVDLQRRCYEAFCVAWNDRPFLAGVYFWNWFGWGGPSSKEYTPRGKPAEDEVAKWYRGPEKADSANLDK